MWRIELFGGLRAVHEQQEWHRFRTQKTAALLAYLAYIRKPQAREVLIELLWPDSAVSSGRNNLRIALYSLRRQLEPSGVPCDSIITANRSLVTLTPKSFVTDVAEFETAARLAALAPRDAVQQIELWNMAFNLYGGPLLHGLYESWVPVEEQRLEELFIQCLLQLITCLEADQQFDRALEVAQRGIRLAPHHPKARLAVERLTGTTGGERLWNGETIAGRRTRNRRRCTVTTPDLDTVTFLTVNAPQHKLLTESQRSLFRDAIARNGGVFVAGQENSISIAFPNIRAAVSAAGRVRRLQHDTWPVTQSRPVVRMVLTAGNEIPLMGIVQGDVLQEARRILHVARPGQLLCDESTAAVLHDHLNCRKSPTVRIIEMGTYQLPGEARAQRLFLLDDIAACSREFSLPAPNGKVAPS